MFGRRIFCIASSLCALERPPRSLFDPAPSAIQCPSLSATSVQSVFLFEPRPNTFRQPAQSDITKADTSWQAWFDVSLYSLLWPESWNSKGQSHRRSFKRVAGSLFMPCDAPRPKEARSFLSNTFFPIYLQSVRSSFCFILFSHLYSFKFLYSTPIHSLSLIVGQYDTSARRLYFLQIIINTVNQHTFVI